MSFATEMLEKVELMLLGKANNDVQSYSIKGRQLSKYTIGELMQLRSELKAEIEKENFEKALKAAGKKKVKGVRYV